MARLYSQPGQAPRTHRRTVRIVKPKKTSRAAMITLIAAAAAALSFPLVWSLRQPEQVISPPRLIRTWEWKCEGGHLFNAEFQADSRVCVQCGRTAYPVGWYTCHVHGSFEVMARFASDGEHGSKPTHLRLIGRKWVSENELFCPRCERPLVYKGKDPLERTRRGQKTGGS